MCNVHTPFTPPAHSALQFDQNNNIRELGICVLYIYTLCCWENDEQAENIF